MAGKDQIFGKHLKLKSPNRSVVTLDAGATIELPASQTFIVDATDTTKRMKFDASGVTTATTRTFTLPDSDLNLGTGVGSKRSVLASSGNTTMTSAMTGSIMLMDAAAVSYALPAIGAGDIGMHFTFFWTAATTSNGVITAQTGDLMVGFANLGVAGAADIDTYFPVTSFLVLTANGTTTGGLAGSVARFTAISATAWGVEAHLKASGTQATPFS